MRFHAICIVLVFIITYNATKTSAQDKSFPKAIIIDTVAVSETESYALYIPTSFSSEIPTAVVYIFDPAARGSFGIQPFIEASEKYNYLLVCSNNSRNGPISSNLEVVNRLFAHVFSNFTIDPNKVYVSGFSGGSRLATSVAILTNQINAVVGCGAGISQYDMQIPLNKPSFNYVGVVGTRDMNYQEMFRYEERLEKFGINAEIIPYDGDHSWPPSEIIVNAFDWVELKNKQHGFSSFELSLFEENFRNAHQKVKQLENKNRIHEAVLQYQRLQNEYSSIVLTSEIRAHLESLRKTPTYKKQKKQAERIKKTEAEVRKVFEDKFFNDMKSIASSYDYDWWKKELNKFKSKYSESEEVIDRQFYDRTWYALYAMTVENAQIYSSNNKVAKAVYAHTITSLMYPDKSFPFILLAKNYAVLFNEDKMIQNLEIAAQKGYPSFETLFANPIFLRFSNSEKFNAFKEKQK